MPTKKKRPKVPADRWVQLTSTIKAEEGIEYTNEELIDKLIEIVNEHYNIER